MTDTNDMQPSNGVCQTSGWNGPAMSVSGPFLSVRIVRCLGYTRQHLDTAPGDEIPIDLLQPPPSLHGHAQRRTGCRSHREPATRWMVQDRGLLPRQDRSLQHHARLQGFRRRLHTGQVLRRLHRRRGLEGGPRRAAQESRIRPWQVHSKPTSDAKTCARGAGPDDRPGGRDPRRAGLGAHRTQAIPPGYGPPRKRRPRNWWRPPPGSRRPWAG